MVITQNLKHPSISPLAIGKGLKTKVNANVGTSKDHMNVEEELEKVRVATPPEPIRSWIFPRGLPSRKPGKRS